MCFDALHPRDRALLVACATPSTSREGGERIVGFCGVDGRDPDPSCKIEFLSPSALAATSPRPYLSDLGVATAHRRRGVGESLVRACEEWTRRRGHDKLYLKVEEKNEGGMGLYLGMGYRKVVLPWKNCGSRWEATVLLEKSLRDDASMGRKRRWMKRKSRLVRRIWRDAFTSGGKILRRSSTTNGGPPL